MPYSGNNMNSVALDRPYQSNRTAEKTPMANGRCICQAALFIFIAIYSQMYKTYLEIMKYYTLAKKVNQTYGHGDSGDEYVIKPIDSYHTGSKEYHPLFESEDEAEDYKNKLRFSHDIVIVCLSVH